MAEFSCLMQVPLKDFANVFNNPKPLDGMVAVDGIPNVDAYNFTFEDPANGNFVQMVFTTEKCDDCILVSCNVVATNNAIMDKYVAPYRLILAKYPVQKFYANKVLSQKSIARLRVFKEIDDNVVASFANLRERGIDIDPNVAKTYKKYKMGRRGKFCDSLGRSYNGQNGSNDYIVRRKPEDQV